MFTMDLLKSKGFTLAEIIIVMGVIGIVAQLTIPAAMKNFREQAT